MKITDESDKALVTLEVNIEKLTAVLKYRRSIAAFRIGRQFVVGCHVESDFDHVGTQI